ncbi:MAG: hypothetical protein IPJ74_20720 [Saprospiraceae bacterium]|nr:hypothetical protein [Saprospiraceae bacterium]
MKEIRLAPLRWLTPINGTLLNQLSNWQEEVRFWSKEAASLRMLIHKGVTYCDTMDQENLERIEQELILFGSKQILVVENALMILENLIEQKKYIVEQYREVEQQIISTRKSYQDLKIKLLPFLSKFIAIKIW